MLHDTGLVVWHNVPALHEIVVINPQWFADAMAGIVTFMNVAISNFDGMTNWRQIKELLDLKYPTRVTLCLYFDVLRFPEHMHSIIITLLERFEIVYKMKPSKGIARTKLHDEQMFFVPSLLSAVGTDQHHAIQCWKQFESM